MATRAISVTRKRRQRKCRCRNPRLHPLEYQLAAASFDDLATPPNFGFHPLTGDRAGRFAMTVTRNYRLTFAKIDEHTVADLDLEDYH